MESAIAEQKEIFGRIARTVENLKKSGSAKITSSLVATTIRLLDRKWERFESRHGEIRKAHWEELKKHEYHTKDFWGLAEDTYAQQRAELLDMEEALKGLKEAARSSSFEGPLPPRTTLPRIQIPSFSGKFEDWPPFRDLFLSLIGRDPSIANVTRLHYLKASLKGEAELLVRDLPTTDENFDRAWQILTSYYENTRLLVRSYYSTLTALPKMKTESASDLRKIFHGMTSTVGALESVGRPITSSEDLFVHLVVELLDPISRREWENAIGDTVKPPSYTDLRQFVERRLRTLEATQPAKAVDTAKPGTTKTARTHHARKEGKKEKERCPLCHKDHFIMWCDTFRKKSASERKSFVEGAGLCSNCLGKHKQGECQSKRTCSVCNGQHHSTLHDACRPAANESRIAVSEVTKTSHLARPCFGDRSAVLLATARVAVRDCGGELQMARALIDQGSEISIVSEGLAQHLRLPRTKSPVTVIGVGGRKTGSARSQVTLELAARTGGQLVAARAFVLPSITPYTGSTNIAIRDWPHLRDLELADPDFLEGGTIDVLLGAGVYTRFGSATGRRVRTNRTGNITWVDRVKNDRHPHFKRHHGHSPMFGG